ncbi:BCLAF1 and THRAP3 family member 3 isoform X2 [Desmodus rotundus]|uniref:BCLAF1 and THRAP3 family member 3 isoform X2 n=1 Tax=Desmodus rotundus TaxID=9430 RepID=UPI0023815AAE|nr:BCLAF1 and THRAP3 family member 3 isoform X2 [Desmodus rotundus]
MAQSRSRSPPRGKQRSLSPAPRKSEHYKQRHSHGYRGYDSRKDPNRSTTGRMHKNDGQSRPRNSCHENTYYRFHKHRSHSPNTRSSLDQFYSYKPYQAYLPGREDGNRYMPRYSEGVYYQEYQWDYYPQHMQGRSIPYDHRRRSGKRGKSPQRSTEDSSRFEGKQHEDELRSQKIRDEKYFYSLRRGPEDFEKRSSSQKRHTEDRDYRRRGHTSKRQTGVERHKNRELSRNPQCKPRHPTSSHQEKKAQRSPKFQAHRHAQKRPPETSSAAKASSGSRHKRRKTSHGAHHLSDGKSQKYSKEEDRKDTSQNNNGKSSCSNAGRRRETKGRKDKKPLKSSKKDCTASAHSDRSIGLKSTNDKRKTKRKKERDGRKKSNSSSNQLDERKPSDVKPSSSSRRKKSLTVKVNKKKTVNTSRKSKDLKRVFKHLDSTENTENKRKEKFAQEITTAIHQVKVNKFPSPPITLHERFSKIKDQRATAVKESKLTSGSGNHRRINMSLAELPNKHIMTLVKVIDPNDLRHDIERRRKERLQNEDEHIFHIDSATERNNQLFHFSTPVGGPQNPQWAKKSNSTKCTQKTCMNNCRGGRLQSHYKSGLVQKSLCIQAKYQRLRFTGSKEFITNKCRQRFLKKKEHTNMAMALKSGIDTKGNHTTRGY